MENLYKKPPIPPQPKKNQHLSTCIRFRVTNLCDRVDKIDFRDIHQSDLTAVKNDIEKE